MWDYMQNRIQNSGVLGLALGTFGSGWTIAQTMAGPTEGTFWGTATGSAMGLAGLGWWIYITGMTLSQKRITQLEEERNRLTEGYERLWVENARLKAKRDVGVDVAQNRTLVKG
jgi:hypothetical protein